MKYSKLNHQRTSGADLKVFHVEIPISKDVIEGNLPRAENVASQTTKTSFMLTIIKIQSMKEVYSYDKTGTKRASRIQSEPE